MKFTNSKTNETISVEKDEVILLRYIGYLGHSKEVEAKITEINQESIKFAVAPDGANKESDHEVRLADIQGFRKMWKYKPIFIPLTNAAVGIGSYFILAESDLSETNSLLVSLGLSYGSHFLLSYFLDGEVENFMSEGWSYKAE